MNYIVVIAIVIQIVLFVSIFDIYFTSPIIRGVKPLPNTVSTSSERVVVISIDGLRYDALFEDDPQTSTKVAPFLSWIMSRKGTWGKSHCRMPTESRPGHVAMLAGFYEDPSAVTKGWKENPVDFDSIFNQSQCSFAWGSPDIVDIFFKDLNHKCAYKWTYDEKQDFAGNTMDLDNWVFNQVEHFFKNDEPEKFSNSKTLFFLHLLGQDTSGHTHKPKTELYRQNLKNADSIIRRVNALFEETFRDNKTTFVVTADHGMTDWGSHGAGDPSETVTPVVAWGAGIKTQVQGQTVEINQADITPLLAVLLGVSIPVNSIGVLPTKFLNFSNLVVAEANRLNTDQICAQYLAKRDDIEVKSSLMMYKKFQLTRSQTAVLLQMINDDIRQGRHVSANEKSSDLLNECLEGINFYQTYFQKPLFFAITSSYIGWMLFLWLHLQGFQIPPKASLVRSVVLTVLAVSAGASIYFTHLPLTYYAYALLPIFLWWSLSAHIKNLVVEIGSTSLRQLVFFIFVVIGIEILVLGFFERFVYCICLAFIVLWPYFELGVNAQNYKLIGIWTISGGLLGSFAMLPVVGKQPDPLLTISSSVLISFFSGLCSYNRSRVFFPFVRCLLILGAGVNSYLVHSNYFNTAGLHEGCQMASWALLLLTPLTFIEQSTGVLEKLADAFSSLSIPFLLLSISHEGFFLLVLFVHVACWVKLEMFASDIVGQNFYYRQFVRRRLHDNIVSLADFRRAYIFLAYVIIAFFGLGNLATLNSFDPTWVRCFLTTFSPFVMTALVLFKIIIPFLAATLALRALTVLLDVRPSVIFLTIVIYCNLMGLNFLFLVRNEGSWLDIGSSLSHYVIQQVTVVFLLVLFFVAQIIIPSKEAKTGKSHFF